MEVHSGSGFDQEVGAETKPPSGKLSLFVARCSSCSVAGVVVSCKIPILATRVRFPGDAELFNVRLLLPSMRSGCKPFSPTVPAWPNG